MPWQATAQTLLLEGLAAPADGLQEGRAADTNVDVGTPHAPRHILWVCADGKGWPWLCYIPGVYYLCEAFDDVYDQLLPAVDLDGDRFSPAETLRGSIWRGRDCGDLDRDVYPGTCRLDARL